jgi:hypothetical protein
MQQNRKNAKGDEYFRKALYTVYNITAIKDESKLMCIKKHIWSPILTLSSQNHHWISLHIKIC